MLIAREVQVACRHGIEVNVNTSTLDIHFLNMKDTRQADFAFFGQYKVAIVIGGRNVFCSDTWVAATGTDRASTHPIG
jgi:hypothetical protein